MRGVQKRAVDNSQREMVLFSTAKASAFSPSSVGKGRKEGAVGTLVPPRCGIRAQHKEEPWDPLK